MKAGFKFDPREWQRAAAEIVAVNAIQGQRSALISACPGAGKTLGGLLIARVLINRLKKTNTIVVVTPSLAIKSQWIKKSVECFGLHLCEVKDVRELLEDRLPFGVDGYILSYQQAVMNQNVLRVFCSQFKPVVVLDEVHHTAGTSESRGGNAWGVAVEDAFRNASFVLCTTGTPFRQGNNPIAFVHYNDDGEAVATYKYPLRQAIRDGICRPIDFQLFNGEIKWTSRAGEIVKYTFDDNLSKKLQRERLEAALSTDGDFPVQMLEAADDRLNEIRSGGGVDANAGGLVVAIDTAHANAIASVLERISGEAPVIVHNKIDDAQDKIAGFEGSDKKWIVGISMISEGVDIPRLRVGVYATRVRAPLYFHQFCGRFQRVQVSPKERSYVFLPRDPELEALVKEINQEKYHALGDEGERLVSSTRPGVGRKRRELDVEQSDGHVEASVFDGETYTMEEIRLRESEIVAFKNKHPSLNYIPPSEALKIIDDRGLQ